ncbi:hypothetical protein TNCV_92851 [Trichonephila clavipes]|nr:hypothetical protein TNCV_92851 [Trichonephila clavipes]
MKSPKTSCGQSCNNLCNWAVNSSVFRDACSCFQASPRRDVLVKGLMTWQAMGVRYILKDIVGKVKQYVNKHCLADKWHLSDLITF